MLKEVQTVLEKIYEGRREHKSWQKVVAVLGIITVFCTTYALILPAVTLESSPDAICGVEEHTHTSDCYERRPVLICENTDPDHEHTDDCYKVESVIVCGKEPHKHKPACYPKEEPKKEEKVIETEAPTTVPSAFDEAKETLEETKLEETTATEAQTSEAETTVTEASETETTATEPSETTTTEETTAAEETEETTAEEIQEETVDLPEYESRTVIRRAGLLNPKMTKSESESPMQLKKTVSSKPNDDGYYTITLEAYAKGSGSIEFHTSVAPTDIVLVLDQSGSMSWPFGKKSKTGVMIDAVNAFIDQVIDSAKGDDGEFGNGDDVDHRIALVGFASKDDYYKHTGLFLNTTNKLKNYGRLKAADYKNAFYSMTNSTQRTNIKTASGRITNGGATYVNLGLDMAKEIFKNNPDPTRNRLVVVFTDGVPGASRTGGWYYNPSGDQQDSGKNAEAAIATSKELKSNYKATVYSIGIFAGADASKNGTMWDDSTWTYSEAEAAPYANYFMHHLSSNYNSKGEQVDTRYYMSASNANALMEAFEAIATAVESGGSQNTELKENTTVIDAVSDYFEFPEGADKNDVKVYTVDSNAVNGTEPVFDEGTKKPLAAEVAFNDGKMSVKGFDYSANWCGAIKKGDTYTAHPGKKIVIEVPVKPKDDFIGGYDVPTNKDNSGVYLNGEQIGTFEVPDTDVPFTGEAYGAKKTVYYGTKLTAKELYFSNEGLPQQTWIKLAKYVEFIKNNATKSGDYYVIGNTEYNIELPDFADSEEANPVLTSTKTGTHAIKIQMRKKSPAGSWSGYNVSAEVYVLVPQVTFQDTRGFFGMPYTGNDCLKNNVEKAEWVPDGNWVEGENGVPNHTGEPTYDISKEKLTGEFQDTTNNKLIGTDYTMFPADVNVNVIDLKADGKSIMEFAKFDWVGCEDYTDTQTFSKHDANAEHQDEFVLHSKSGATLPATGGSGVKNWFIIGLSLMTTPIMIGLSIKRKRSLINIF